MAPVASKRGLKLDRFLPYRLSYSTGLLSEVLARVYRRRFDLSIPEWRVVAHVAENAGITQQEIGHRTRMDKVTVSRAARALRARGIISQRANPVDRRARLLRLTASGRRLYAAIAPKALALEHAVFRQFSAREVANLHIMLARIDAASERLLSAER